MTKSDYHLFTPLLELQVGIPTQFPSPFNTSPHPLAKLAAEKLQNTVLPKLNHNFGLQNKTTRPIGKMLGVLVVKNEMGNLGYISAFSGKLNGGNHYQGFVPPVYDGLQEGGFLNKGMSELSVIVNQVRVLQETNDISNQHKLKELIARRAQHSKSLQQKLFESYHFLNSNKESKSLIEIFSNKQPQGGSGECAAPKLLQYAYINDLEPVSIAEFWWGISPKSQHRIHAEYYPACEEKCRPILNWMLS